MKIIIMLCGQGCVGKSTYAKKIKDNLSEYKVKIASLDYYNRLSKSDTKENLLSYIKEVSDSLLDNDIVICDQANDVVNNRYRTLSEVVNNFNCNDISLICISLHPKIETIIRNYDLNGAKLDETYLNKIRKAYNDFRFPTQEEFKDYNFKSVDLYAVDNNEDISILDISYLTNKIKELEAKFNE